MIVLLEFIIFCLFLVIGGSTVFFIYEYAVKYIIRKLNSKTIRFYYIVNDVGNVFKSYTSKRERDNDLELLKKLGWSYNKETLIIEKLSK